MFHPWAAVFDSKYFTKSQIDRFLDKYEVNETTPGDPFQDCIADYYHAKFSSRISSYVDTKDQGNIALKNGRYKDAIELYSKALCQCHLFTFSLRYLDWNHDRLHGSAKIVFRDIFVVKIIESFLKEKIVLSYRNQSIAPNVILNEPNRAAAICFANRSYALLLEGKTKEALQDADAAIKVCPEYVKGHFRKAKALQKLNRLKEAQDIMKQISYYDEDCKHCRSYLHGLLANGPTWLTWNEYIFHYGELRFRIIMEWICRQCGAGNVPRVQIIACVIPILGCQGLTFGAYFINKNFKQIFVSHIDWIVIDRKNGDLLEGPRKELSPLTKKHIPTYVCNLIYSIKQAGLSIEPFMLGGDELRESVDVIQKKAAKDTTIANVPIIAV